MNQTIRLVEVKRRDISSLFIGELITSYELSNIVDGRSEKTIRWYSEILKAFNQYLKDKGNRSSIANFNIDVIRDYILYLRSRPKFFEHPYTPAQNTVLSQQTMKGHIRGLKAFSTWLFVEGYTNVNFVQQKFYTLYSPSPCIYRPQFPKDIRYSK